MKKHMRSVLALVLVMVMTLTACGGGAATATPEAGNNAAPEKDVLTIAHFGDVVTLDPHGTQSTVTNLVKVNIFENLVKQEADGTIVPELAESWEQVDETTYIFKLRQDVKFSNGDAMTAEDVVYSLARSASSPTTSALAGMIDYENCKVIDEFRIL